eukprot:10269690-Alexandrium_andersonii.AAC.1
MAPSAAQERQTPEPPPCSLPDSGGAALRAAPPASGPAEVWSPTSADSEPRRGASAYRPSSR